MPPQVRANFQAELVNLKTFTGGKMLKSFSWAAIIVTVVLAAPLCNAQSTNASIYGTVTDATGAAVGKAAVTAVNINTGVALPTVTNDSGLYIFPSLLPGSYTVTAELTGFRKEIAEHLRLEVGAKITVDLKLQVGATTDSVSVDSTTSPLEAVNSSVSNVVTVERVQGLPLQNLDAGALISLQAGVVGDNFNGARSQSQNVTLDGVNVQETRYNGGWNSGNTTAVSAVDLVGEFRVSTAPVDAEFGRGMAQVQMISRSGTNEVHGSAFEFNRVTALSANSWFNNQLGRNSNDTSGRAAELSDPQSVRSARRRAHHQEPHLCLLPLRRSAAEDQCCRERYGADGHRAAGHFPVLSGRAKRQCDGSRPDCGFEWQPGRCPRAATGPLQTVSLFGRDPNRLVADPTGNVAIALKDVPLPNNFQRGDGLNTAGYYWQQPATNNFNFITCALITR